MSNLKVLAIFVSFVLVSSANYVQISEEESYETETDIVFEPLPPTPSPPSPSPTPSSSSTNDEISSSYSSSDDIIANNTRCSQTQLSFTKETLLHIWEIKGLIGYISYIKRFDQPFEVKTDHVSFKSDNVDGKWIFKVHKIRHHNPFALHTSSSPTSTSSSATASAGFVSSGDIGDIRIVAIYSYEAKQPKSSDFIIRPSIIHGSKEIMLPPQKSTSPTIVQQKFYNTRGYQLNSNFLEYVYTFTWDNVIQHLNSIKSSIYNMKYQFDDAEGTKGKSSEGEKSSYYLHNNGQEASEELFEEITRTDFSGHFGDVTIKFVITAFFPEKPVSVTSSRCNSSVLDLVSHNVLEKLTTSSKQSTLMKDLTHHRYIGRGTPPYLRYSNSMLHDDRFADVILVVGEDEIPAHRIILATSSPVFSEILENTTTYYSPITPPPAQREEGDKPHCPQNTVQHRLPRILVEPHDIDSDCVLELLRYIYTGNTENIRLNEGHLAYGLILLADKYGFPELKRQCETTLLQHLKAENAIEMYVLGKRVASHKLTRKALIVMKLNKARLASQTEEFRELSLSHPTLMYELFLAD